MCPPTGKDCVCVCHSIVCLQSRHFQGKGQARLTVFAVIYLNKTYLGI